MGLTKVTQGIGALAMGVALVVAGGCSSSSKKAADTTSPRTTTNPSVVTGSSGTTTTTTPAKKLTIVVTNDDGYNAPGIDTVVQALRKLPNVDIAVVAPATNQSGQGGATTSGTLRATSKKTLSGYPATAVEGHPADTIRYALDTMHLDPDLVVSGVNLGQNVGSLIDISGTVGAARAAAARGIPAVASSQGIGSPVQFGVTAAAVIRWINVNRATLHRDPGSKAGTIVNINGPSCAKGLKPRGTLTLAPAPAGTANTFAAQNCASTANPTNDVEGLNDGFIVVDTIPLAPAAAPSN